MYIKCPNCSRRGYLPDRLVPAANSLRCRKCQAQFVTPDLARLGAEQLAGSRYDSSHGVVNGEKSSKFQADSYFSGYEHAEGLREPGAGDSNYELTFTLKDAGGDSGNDWREGAPNADPEAPSSDEINAVPEAAEVARLPALWAQRFMVSWAPYWIGGVLAIAIPLGGYLLWCMVLGVATARLPAPSLIAGLACTVGLLLISIPLLLVAASLTQLVQEVRALRDQPRRRL